MNDYLKVRLEGLEDQIKLFNIEGRVMSEGENSMISRTIGQIDLLKELMAMPTDQSIELGQANSYERTFVIDIINGDKWEEYKTAGGKTMYINLRTHETSEVGPND